MAKTSTFVYFCLFLSNMFSLHKQILPSNNLNYLNFQVCGAATVATAAAAAVEGGWLACHRMASETEVAGSAPPLC